ncbi:MAG: hypothetical protein BWY40_00583 [bacterium ADurb.Bin270]|jgi:hypothetical protein|nr:hypothetical protein [Myxococcales bacterium]OQA61570.1 MAG: hypothetical protein BWY40_00583 [bacterium ADurb.Bin270]
MKKNILIILMLLASCGGQYGDDISAPRRPFALKLPDKALGLSYSQAYATIDGDPYRHDLSQDFYSGEIYGEIYGVPVGMHTIGVYLEGKTYDYDSWVKVLSASVSVDVCSGCYIDATFNEEDIFYPDDDGDGISNLDELLVGSDPFTAVSYQDTAFANLENYYGQSYMNSEYHDEYCGNIHNGLPNPLRTSIVTLYITEAYKTGNDIFTTEESEWLFVDASGEEIVRAPYRNFINYKTPIHFVMDDGMVCTGALESNYGSHDLDLECTRDGLSCTSRYD